MKNQPARQTAETGPQPVTAWRKTATGLELHVRLTPRSSGDRIEGLALLADGRQILKARVRALPEDGRANVALQRLLAAFFGRPVAAVTLIAGATTRIKTLAVTGDPEGLARKLSDLAPPAP
ncbi:MAG: DUF167 domain-containing protein [Hyphomicrobiales bacterium]|nr:DUF167 domain-containing protein [Hyphomicrobiales bacterium]